MSRKKITTGKHSVSGKAKLNESLSALMDGEASEFEFRRVLKECASDPAMKGKWERFHMLSAHLRGDRHFHRQPSASAMADHILLDRIHGQLAREGVKGFSEPRKTASTSTAEPQQAQEKPDLLFRIGQGAIAASVAFTVLLGAQLLNNANNPLPAPELAEQAPAGSVEFNNNYSPTEFNRVPRVNTELADVEDLNEAARDRLRRAVYQEFIGEPQESIELPVNFSVTREAQSSQNGR